MFSLKDKESFPDREERILALWKREKVFQRSLEATKKGKLFSFYDGPPFATGLPHYGHIVAGTIKDVVQRYQTMRGRYVPRQFGWDCHGLPVENEIEKTKELSGAPDIEKFGIARFNEECRSIVQRYTSEWETTVERMGRWVDFQQTWKTMDKNFMESVWWVFSEIYKKGLVYEGFKVMPFSAKLGTPISNFEANLNYRDVDDPSIVVKFFLEDEPDVAFLAWTTTPWSLVSNLALAVGPDFDYVKIRDDKGGVYILAEGRVKNYFEQYEVLGEYKGRDLVGKKYLPMFPYFAERENAFRVIGDGFVTLEDGTGVVQLAPAFGETDFYACMREGIEIVCPIDGNGHFTDEIPEYAGMLFKDAEKEIIRRLKKEGKMFLHTQIRHRYPFCWRSDTPLMYRAVRTWFVAVEKIKDKILSANQQIHWVPDHIKDGRFGKWLENARDWAISRSRYWGTPIPLWRSDDGDIIVISSVKELQDRTGKEIIDLHRHFIDDLTFVEKGKTYRRIPDVFDCWFESGSMPYAQKHYPFEHKVETMEAFPADFIAEGIDQTRAWFYTLNVLSAALFDKPAFKNVIVNGIVLAEDGTKMSKRLKNYPPPELVIEKYGADAIRLYLLSSPAVVADDLRFSGKGVEHVLRQVLIPMWNSYVFLATYAQIYQWKPSSDHHVPHADIDRWILSLTQKLVQDVQQGFDAYELQQAVLPLTDFIDQLTNWYIRRCRGRFWADDDTPDRREAFSTLYTVLLTLVKVAAPFIPFLADAIYQELKSKGDPDSVHLCSFPSYVAKLRDLQLEHEMQEVQSVVSIGHALRKTHQLKVRQPLAKAHVICSDEKRLDAMQRSFALIADELNVKHVEFSREEEAFVSLHIKANFRVLGKKVGGKMQEMAAAITKLPQKEIHRILKGSTVAVLGFDIGPEDVAIERVTKEGVVAATDGGLTIALDMQLTSDLLLEGMARELVNKINTMRKEQNLEVTDRITLKVETTPRVKEALEKHRDYVCHEVLAKSFSFETVQAEELDINGEKTKISFSKSI
ncbi:MAG: isoleucine--tRNA ligase [Verrucomicrobia bacterium]|nr:isoleucine--tRNA ligase [Verrucomicrobiota bacterium]